MASPAPTSNPTQPATTAEHDPDFAKFDEYPWARDRAFLQGLTAMLGPLSNTFERQKALGVTLQARIWWYKSKFNVEIDRTAYEDYVSTTSHTPSIDSTLLDKIDDIQRRMGTTSGPVITGNLPAWMVEAPQKVDLSAKADDGGAPREGGGGRGSSAPYPAHFQAIIEAVTTGKTVPGVRDIPNTVVRQEGILPVGKMQAPPKPWERQRAAAASAVEDISIAANLDGGRHMLDKSFPPMGGDDVGGAGGGGGGVEDGGMKDGELAM